MNIINTQRFKNRKRLITEPVPSREEPTFSELMLNNNTSKGSGQTRFHPKETNTRSTSNKHEDECKPFKSQIIYLEDPFTSQQIQQIPNQKEEKKKKPYRYLQIDTSKQESINSKLMAKSLSKERNSSSQSLRIHKIKSIINLQAKKQECIANRQSIKHPKAYRYENAETKKSNEINSKARLMKTMVEQKKGRERRLKTQLNNDPSDIIQHLKLGFYKVKGTIKKIQDEVRAEDESYALQLCYDQLSNKNKKASLGIVFRFLKSKYKKLLHLSWTKININ